MAFWPKRTKRPHIRSAYRRLRGCDCPSCSALTWLHWLEQPAGAWSTVMVIVAIIGLAAACCWLWPDHQAPISAALRG